MKHFYSTKKFKFKQGEYVDGFMPKEQGEQPSYNDSNIPIDSTLIDQSRNVKTFALYKIIIQPIEVEEFQMRKFRFAISVVDQHFILVNPLLELPLVYFELAKDNKLEFFKPLTFNKYENVEFKLYNEYKVKQEIYLSMHLYGVEYT